MEFNVSELELDELIEENINICSKCMKEKIRSCTICKGFICLDCDVNNKKNFKSEAKRFNDYICNKCMNRPFINDIKNEIHINSKSKPYKTNKKR